MADFFLYKQTTYKNILDNFEKVEPIVMMGVKDYIKEDYIKVLRSSIRLTYFHCIETLFEIIFAIERGIRTEVNEHQDEMILQRLSTSDYRKNFERISRIASSDADELKRFSEKIYLDVVGEEISILRYIFYYILSPKNVNITKEWWDRMEPSLAAIGEALRTLAKDFSERKEYNAYKHGLRIIQMKQKFQVYNSESTNEMINFDFSDSMTFITESKDELTLITKNFDTERDYKMSIVASDLIASIINIRKAVYFRKGEETMIKFFEDDKIKSSSKQNINVREMKINFKKGR